MTVGQSRRRVRLKCDETVSTTRSTNFETSCPYQPLPGEILILIILILILIILILIMAYTQNTYGTNTYRYSFRR